VIRDELISVRRNANPGKAGSRHVPALFLGSEVARPRETTDRVASTRVRAGAKQRRHRWQRKRVARRGNSEWSARLPALMTTVALKRAFDALDDCDEALETLESGCCKPERSPRMEALATTLADARAGFGRVGDDPEQADALFAQLEDAGAQLGWLQVGCCAPSRLPLYTRMLTNLTKAQRSLTRELDRGH